MARDYYLILGVGSDATPDQIKSAYRREAKRLHPDRSGEGCEPFHDVQEAYEVLGDPRRRRAYDDELARARRDRRAASQVGPEPLRQRRPPVEPLIPTQRPGGGDAPFRRSSFPFPFEEFLRDTHHDWEAPLQPAARTGRAGEIVVRVSLTREQSLRGGRIRIWLPGQIRCPSCQGWGRISAFECPRCFGSGSVVDELPVDISFPGGLDDGSEARVSLRKLGMGDLTLVLRFRADEW